MIQLSTEQINRAFLNAVEFLDPVIRDASLNVPRIWVNLLPRATMELGKGLVRTKTRFYADIVDQSGLTNWKQIQKGRAPGTLGVDDPGYDACSYEADMISYAFEQVNWTGYQTSKRTLFSLSCHRLTRSVNVRYGLTLKTLNIGSVS